MPEYSCSVMVRRLRGHPAGGYRCTCTGFTPGSWMRHYCANCRHHVKKHPGATRDANAGAAKSEVPNA